MGKTRIIIIEDEIIISDNLKNHLEETGKYIVVSQEVSYEKAIDAINAFIPDIVLIDIKIKGKKTGLDIGDYINKNFENLIFLYITSYIDEDTINKAKETHPAGYLSKPFNFNTVYTTIEIALHNNQDLNKDMIEIMDGKKMHRIDSKKIIYIKADKIYLDLYFSDKKITIRNTLVNVLKLLPSEKFAQINRSCIVNRDFIQEISKNTIKINNTTFKISKYYTNTLL